MSRPRYMTRNTNTTDPGGMPWTFAQGQRVGTADDHAGAIELVGAGWHHLRDLTAAGMSGDLIFALCRAGSMRLDGWVPCTDEPIYLLFF